MASAAGLRPSGHFCIQNGSTRVVEYSDMPNEIQGKTNIDGGILFNGGSVAIHIFDRDFIASLGDSRDGSKLPFHRADKKIPHVNAAGEMIQPDSPNGVKFEMFVFDALPLAKNPIIIEAARADDFSPVKNAEGVDSPQSSKEDQLRMFARWLKSVGKSIEIDDSGLPAINFEISPRFAVDESDFVAQWVTLNPKTEIKDGAVIQ